MECLLEVLALELAMALAMALRDERQEVDALMECLLEALIDANEFDWRSLDQRAHVVMMKLEPKKAVYALSRSLYRSKNQEKEEDEVHKSCLRRNLFAVTRLKDFQYRHLTSLPKDETPLEKKDDGELDKGDTCKDGRLHHKEKMQTKWQKTTDQIFAFVLQLCNHRSLCDISRNFVCFLWTNHACSINSSPNNVGMHRCSVFALIHVL